MGYFHRTVSGESEVLCLKEQIHEVLLINVYVNLSCNNHRYGHSLNQIACFIVPTKCRVSHNGRFCQTITKLVHVIHNMLPRLAYPAMNPQIPVVHPIHASFITKWCNTPVYKIYPNIVIMTTCMTTVQVWYIWCCGIYGLSIENDQSYAFSRSIDEILHRARHTVRG